MNNINNTKSIKFSTFIITISSLIIIFIMILVGIIFYYEYKLANQETDLTLIPNIYNDDINSIDEDENIVIVE